MNAKNRSTGIPSLLLDRPTRVIRPKDAADTYANPSQELGRLTERGLVQRLANGYYVIVPQDRVGAVWRPSVASVALGIAVSDYGRDLVALMGPSAARHHGLIPRELSTAAVAVPSQRRPLALLRGHVLFVKRDVGKLDLARITTELGDGWVTTLEQTALDLLSRADAFGLPRPDVAAAITSSVPHLDWEITERIAQAQRKVAAYRMLRARSDESDA